MFTYQYAQPDDYRYSLDSIEFAKFVANTIRARHDLASLRILDLCAGCGVLGFELSWHLRVLRHFDFVEVQEKYTAYFHRNVAIVNRPELHCQWHLMNYDGLCEKAFANQFDIIISNPPYFQPGRGMLSPSEFKNRCRFFLDSTFENYITAIVNTLAPSGRAYFLLRSQAMHGQNIFLDVETFLQGKNATIAHVSDIRGTHVACIEKNASSE